MKNQKQRITILSISLWFALNVLFVNLIQAQSNDFYFGVQAGLGLTESNMLNGDPSYGCSVFTTKDLTKIWFGQLGLTYNHYDAYELFDLPNIMEVEFSNTRLAYIENYMGIAAIGGAQFFDKVKLVIKAGPEVSYSIAGKMVKENLTNGNKTEGDLIRDNDFRFGIISGAGVLVPISNKLRLNIDILNNSAIRIKREDGGKVFRPNSIQAFAGIQMAI
ncbi:MAG: outer membrane beta-barrel protein [Salinivirgaceae bacterium]|nr:outer membrane beta-barrel protein [Salinivirgaceae bacterium]